MSLESLCEIIMLVCFGAVWPISIYKSWTSRNCGDKSLPFLLVIILGYLAGIGKCLLDWENVHWSVLVMYGLNVLMVSVDALLYFRNKALERKAAAA